MKRANLESIGPSFPLISIITINYNGLSDTCEFLDSVRELNYPNVETIVVDNASKVDPSETINELYPWVILVRSDRNLGFSGGNNLGALQAKGAYLFFVNNDTILSPGILNELRNTFEKEKNIGLISPKIKYADQPELIQFAGFTPVHPITGRNKTIGDKEKDQGQYDTPSDTVYAVGTAMMTSQELFRKVGKMPEVYFLYYEELDWSCTFRRAGYRIYYQPSAVVYHKTHASVGLKSPVYVHYQLRNRILFMRRNVKKWQLILFYVYMLLIAIPKQVLSLMIFGKRLHINAIRSAIWWHFQHSANNN